MQEIFIERARELAPRIRARAKETERLRRPHPDTLSELIDAGIIQMCVPKRWGGSEADLQTMNRVVEVISAACLSTGWIASFYIGHNIAMAKFPERAQQEMFGDKGFSLVPTAPAPDLAVRREGGGWIVSGRAPWASGVMDADWVMLSGMVPGEGPRQFIMPASDITIEDVWDFSGMAGTGSNDMIANEVFVPDYRTTSGADFSDGASEGSRIHDNPMYSLPFIVLAYCEIVGVMSGGLTGMAEAYAHIVERRVRNFTGSVVKDLPQAHINLGDIEIAARIARQLADSQATMSMALASSGRLAVNQRLELKANAAFIANHCREAANRVIGKVGASNFHQDSPIQRQYRDINMLANHAFWDWDVCRELIGREQLQFEPNNPLI